MSIYRLITVWSTKWSHLGTWIRLGNNRWLYLFIFVACAFESPIYLFSFPWFHHWGGKTDCLIVESTILQNIYQLCGLPSLLLYHATGRTNIHRGRDMEVKSLQSDWIHRVLDQVSLSDGGFVTHIISHPSITFVPVLEAASLISYIALPLRKHSFQ